MFPRIERRDFLKRAAAGTVAGLGAEEQLLASRIAQAQSGTVEHAPSPMPMPRGTIKGLSLSRLISGGNLIGGWAHSRDLIYVSRLFKEYNTDDRILNTLRLCEEYGINTILTNPVSGAIINRYWNEKGGRIQWISEVHPKPNDYKTSVRSAVDNGASMAYIQGAVGDRLIADGQFELLADTVNFIKECGLPAGVGAHALEVIQACEEAGLDPDYYVKTLHPDDYWSARRADQPEAVIRNPYDNFWCAHPAETIAYMNTVEKPWIAFKVLAAGAVHPQRGFKYAFENGADFICVGMFDFQVAEDADIVITTLDGLERKRPWCA